MHHNAARLGFLSIGLTLTILLSSCASEAAKADLAKKKAQEAKDKADGKEYVLVYPTGSNIPVKVPKDQIVAGSTTDADQDALRRRQERGIKPQSDTH